MQYALERHTNDSNKLFQFTIYADRIRTVDAYKLTRIVCRQFERGIYAMVGTVDPESLGIIHKLLKHFGPGMFWRVGKQEFYKLKKNVFDTLL